jgi:hypothetical protein
MAIVNEIADIDGEILDWSYSIVGSGRIWSKLLEDGRQYMIKVSGEGVSLASKIFVNGNNQRITDCCKPNINRSEIKRFLRNH